MERKSSFGNPVTGIGDAPWNKGRQVIFVTPDPHCKCNGYGEFFATRDEPGELCSCVEEQIPDSAIDFEVEIEIAEDADCNQPDPVDDWDTPTARWEQEQVDEWERLHYGDGRGDEDEYDYAAADLAYDAARERAGR